MLLYQKNVHPPPIIHTDFFGGFTTCWTAPSMSCAAGVVTPQFSILSRTINFTVRVCTDHGEEQKTSKQEQDRHAGVWQDAYPIV